MGANHNLNIIGLISLAATPLVGAQFGRMLVIVPKATNSLNGARFKIYTLASAKADNTLGYISNATLAAVTAMFSNSPQPQTVMIGNVDLVAPETYPQALTAIMEETDGFYGIAIASRADADIVAMSTAVEALNKIFFFQSDDSSLLDAGLPAGLSAIAGRERTIGVYHSSDAQWLDASYGAKGLVYDLDILSSTWNTDVNGVTAYADPGVSVGEREAAFANQINLMLPYFSESFWMDKGVNMNGRAIYEIVSADWAYFRCIEAVARLQLKEAARGRKIPLTFKGQSQVMGSLESVMSLGVQAEHFAPGQTRVTAYPLTQADLDTRTMRFLIEAQILGSARLFSLSLVFSRDAIIAEVVT